VHRNRLAATYNPLCVSIIFTALSRLILYIYFASRSRNLHPNRICFCKPVQHTNLQRASCEAARELQRWTSPWK